MGHKASVCAPRWTRRSLRRGESGEDDRDTAQLVERSGLLADRLTEPAPEPEPATDDAPRDAARPAPSGPVALRRAASEGSVSSEAFPDARALLQKHGLAAKKSFGQNFLVSERAFRAIVDAAVRQDDDWLVEIGGGLGTLTARLAERVPEGKVIVLERDRDMVGVLRAELGNVENVQIEEVDAMRYDLAMVARWRGEPITVCGNLPYHIAAPLIFRTLAARASVHRAIFMVQREMADRIVAAPGSKAYGALGVMVRTYADVSMVTKVSAGSFVPPPKVESAVIRVVPLPGGRTRVPLVDAGRYRAVVQAAFGQRRKTLRNALRARFVAEAAAAALAAAGIDGGRRGETLSIEELAAVANGLSAETVLPGGPPLGDGLQEIPVDEEEQEARAVRRARAEKRNEERDELEAGVEAADAGAAVRGADAGGGLGVGVDGEGAVAAVRGADAGAGLGMGVEGEGTIAAVRGADASRGRGVGVDGEGAGAAVRSADASRGPGGDVTDERRASAGAVEDGRDA